MTHRRSIAIWMSATLATCSAPASPPARAGDGLGAFVVRAVGDTIALERFERSGDRISGALLFRPPGLRVDYALTLSPDRTVLHMESSMRSAAADPAAAPTQSATLDWHADSVIADVRPGGPQRLLSRKGAMPFVNPSILMLELVVRRSLATTPALDTVPLFAVSGGRTMLSAVRRVSADSVFVNMGAVEFRLRIAPDGAVLSGSVPAQLVQFDRVETLPDRLLAMAPPDYSAPAGAPYAAETVRVPTRAGFDLVGTLTRPTLAGPLPCVLLITGSGSQERDEAIPMVRGYRPFRQIADTLARRGIAVLRLDDRGIGASGGKAAGSTSEDFADDVEDALRWLARAEGIDSTRLALLGHSEGGLIAPIVALRGARLRGIVLMAAPAWTGRRIMEFQNASFARQKHSGAALDSVMRDAMHAVDSLSAADPWTGFFARHDPLAVAKKLASPAVLVLQGATDRQVTAEQAAELADAFRSARNPDVTMQVLPATNHLFLPDASGDPAGYPSLAVTAVPRETLGVIADWLSARLLSRAKRRR